MDIQRLRGMLKEIMPYLDENLDKANKEYLAGDISHGTFQHVLSRRAVANQVLDGKDAYYVSCAKTAYTACALLTIDLRMIAKDSKDRENAQRLLDSWLQMYLDAGFTEMTSLFNTPKLPCYTPPPRELVCSSSEDATDEVPDDGE